MAAIWSKVRPGGRSVRSLQAATEAAPVSPSDGLLLEGVAGFHVFASCEAGQSFTGTLGRFLAYLYDADAGGWGKAEDDLDLIVKPTQVGERIIAFPGFVVHSPASRIAHVASGIQVSGGQITLLYRATTPAGFRS